jgi:hypothetical protein
MNYTGQRAKQKFEEETRYSTAKTRKAEADRYEREQNLLIDRRDHRQCRACSKHSDPDAVGLLAKGHRAHIVYASAGGSMDASNRVTLCAECHWEGEHKDRLRFTSEGGPYVGIDANAGMEFWRKTKDGEWYLSRREIAPHVVEKD